MADPSSLRSGFDYQDLIAMNAIIELLRSPTRIVLVELEADDAGSIDDVRIRYSDSRELRKQVKFAVDDTDAWSWEALLSVKRGSEKVRAQEMTSTAPRKKKAPASAQASGTRREAQPLLYKWFDSLREVPTDIDVVGEIVTNRGVSDDVAEALDAEGRLIFDRIPPAIRNQLIAHYRDEELARAIAGRLRFRAEEASFEELEAQVRAAFAQRVNAAHYLHFKDQVRQWGRQQKSRCGPKVIDLDEARRASRFYYTT